VEFDEQSAARWSQNEKVGSELENEWASISPGV
jgi:hypothetical protein